jgi:hypothetical protein
MKDEIKRYCDDLNCNGITDMDNSCFRCVNILSNMIMNSKESVSTSDTIHCINRLEIKIWARFNQIDLDIKSLTLKVKDLSEQLDAAVGTIKDCILKEEYKNSIEQWIVDHISRGCNEPKNKEKDNLNKRPYVCPKCNGDNNPNVVISHEGINLIYGCNPCNGTGVIWK